MKEELEKMLQRHLPLPGLVAWVARQGKGKPVSQCLAGRLTTETIERSLNTLLLTAEHLRGQDLMPETLSMVFERARLCVTFREDGSCLALFVQNNSESKAPVEKLLEEFRCS